MLGSKLHHQPLAFLQARPQFLSLKDDGGILAKRKKRQQLFLILDVGVKCVAENRIH